MSRRSVAVLRHLAFEDLGLLGSILRDDGWDVAYYEASTARLDDPAIEQADLLVVLGGPIGIYEAEAYPFLTGALALLARRLARGAPTLGICLGAQLIARALGARVYAGPVKEVGWGAMTLTEPGRASCLQMLDDDGALVLHWHGDTFDLPPGATLLASNAAYPNQAFAVGDRVLALQFHLEADPARLEEWYVGHAVELAGAGVSVPALRASTAAIAARVTAQAAAIFGAWLRSLPQAGDKAAFYEDLMSQLGGLLAGETDATANAANVAALLYQSLPTLNWAGFYFLRGTELVLGPFQGKPACVRIAVGQGVCGTAVARAASVLVDDVHEFPGHIACDAASQSELVVPLLHEGRVIGVIDLDSPVTGRFDAADRVGIEAVAAAYVAGSVFG